MGNTRAEKECEALREENERLRREIERRDRFFGALSHELRNPLAPIKYGLTILERKGATDQQKGRAVEVIGRQTAQLTRLVENLSDISRSSREILKLDKQPFDLVELVSKAAQDKRSSFEKAGVQLELSPTRGSIPVHADETRIHQVMGIILGNAAEFSSPGGRTRVSVDVEGEETIVCIADDGQGMTEETLASLFEPFGRVRQKPLKKGGLGLGLALCKSLIEAHGGSIGARSEGPEKGSELRFSIPIENSPSPKRKKRKSSPATAPKKVLIIEDLLDAAQSLSMVLQRDGHEVELAEDGVEGVDKARRFLPDVVFCDIGLPRIDGYEVARRLRGETVFENTFLVAISGYAQPSDIENATRAGFDDHISKPPSIKKIRETLRTAPSRT